MSDNRHPDAHQDAREDPPIAVTQLDKYEFDVVYIGTDSPNSKENLEKMNLAGSTGWQLIAADNGYLYFTRQLV